MPRTYTQLLSQYLTLTKDNSTANQALGPILINDSVNTIYNLQGGKLRFLEKSYKMMTVAQQEAYYIPNGIRKIIDMYVKIGADPTAVIYMPEMVFDPTKWKLILAYRLGYNDFPYFSYVENQQFKFQPIPSSSGAEIHIRGRIQTKPLSIPDVTNITVTSISNGGTDMVLSGGATADMVGRYIQIIETSADNGGDGMWYQIGSFTDATHIGLLKPYEGTAIIAGSASCTIGQCSAVPAAYDIAILYRAIATYWTQQKDTGTAKSWWMQYDGGMEAGYSNSYGGIIQQMLDNEGETEEGGYIPPFGSSSASIMQSPYYFPFQQASGF